MVNLLAFFTPALESRLLLIGSVILSATVKCSFLKTLISRGLRAPTITKPWLLLLGILIGSMFGDLAWVIKISQSSFFPEISYSVVTFFIRIAWAFLIVQYQSLSFFIESLVEKEFRLTLYHRVSIILSACCSLYFCYLAFFDSTLTSEIDREMARSLASWPLEIKMMKAVTVYLLCFVTLPSLIFSIKKLRQNALPKILKRQLSVLIVYLIVPYIVIEILQVLQYVFTSFQDCLHPTVSISTIILTYAIYYCTKKVLGLRFLNFADHVDSTNHGNLIDDFKGVLERLTHASSIPELGQITQGFFKDVFNIPIRKTVLFIRNNPQAHHQMGDSRNQIENVVEDFLGTCNNSVKNMMLQSKILIHDEIDFSNFYQEDTARQTILAFLDMIHADVFVPIFEKERIIAYIIVDRHARHPEFYGNIERDEMIVFASYLNNIINLLKNRNMELLIQQEKELQEELYAKHQEINQYKESIRSFLRTSNEKKIGILFYKNRRFIFGNQAAKEIIQVNVNNHEGHPLSKALKKVAYQVEQYKSPQVVMAKDTNGNKLVLSGVTNLEQKNVIISLYYPEISDIITKQIDLLKDPTKWDYLLYLETTKSGKLINELIPASGEIMLNFKIQLLESALSKKATLLSLPEQDILPTVELLHHISLREQLYVLDLKAPCTSADIAIKLFGINPLFGYQSREAPLLKKLDPVGTLFIKNIHFLDRESQEHLAEFIKYGLYRTLKCDQRLASNVRVICSSDQDLLTLLHDGKFSKELFEELKKTTLCMPSLDTLSLKELGDLADGYTEQAIRTEDFKNLLELTEKEKNRLAHTRPLSLRELRSKIQSILMKKSRENNIFHETHFDPAFEITDPDLSMAARLGKQALRDAKIMTMLWNKFKNQNKIAAFLGVNRSSVNRRCKEYNLH